MSDQTSLYQLLCDQQQEAADHPYRVTRQRPEMIELLRERAEAWRNGEDSMAHVEPGDLVEWAPGLRGNNVVDYNQLMIVLAVDPNCAMDECPSGARHWMYVGVLVAFFDADGDFATAATEARRLELVLMD